MNARGHYLALFPGDTISKFAAFHNETISWSTEKRSVGRQKPLDLNPGRASNCEHDQVIGQAGSQYSNL